MTNEEAVPLNLSSWRIIYLLGGTAAILAVLIFRRNFAAELHITNGFGLFNVPDILPVRAVDWFMLLQEERFVGLVFFGLVDLVNYAMVGLIFLALYGALRTFHQGGMLLALVLTTVSTAVYYSTNQGLAMLNLSRQYAAADEASRALIVAAGEALLAHFNPGAIQQGLGYYASLFFILMAGLIISLVMLRSAIFSNITAVIGILANAVALIYFAALLFAPAVVWLPPTLSAPLRMIWYILIAIKLFKLGLRPTAVSS